MNQNAPSEDQLGIAMLAAISGKELTDINSKITGQGTIGDGQVVDPRTILTGGASFQSTRERELLRTINEQAMRQHPLPEDFVPPQQQPPPLPFQQPPPLPLEAPVTYQNPGAPEVFYPQPESKRPVRPARKADDDEQIKLFRSIDKTLKRIATALESKNVKD